MNALFPKFAASRLPILAFLLAIGMGVARAEEDGLPVARLTSLFPAGGQRGTTFEVTVLGDNLDDADRLVFSDPAVTAVPKLAEPKLADLSPEVIPGQFVVTIGPAARLGLCDIRVGGRYGVSNPRAFVVGGLPEASEVEPNDNRRQATPIATGSTVNGCSNRRGDIDFFKFKAVRGQRLILDVRAYRIDSRMDATLTVYSATGVELAHNRDTNRLDPLVDFTAPADGEYYVAVYDFLYGGGKDNFYRLTVSASPYIDFIFPPAGQAGTTGRFTLFGRNLPGSHPAPNTFVDGHRLEMLEVEIAVPADSGAGLSWDAVVEPSEAGMDAIEYHLDSPAGPSNSLQLGISHAPVIAEQEPNDTPSQAQVVVPPCEISGQFNPRRDQDRFSFAAKKGEVYWIEVISERLGEPTDPYLLVEETATTETGEVHAIQTMDDTMTVPKREAAFDIATEDPFCRFVAPADGMVRVMVRNLYYTSSGDPRHLYRLAIRSPRPDFRLAAVPRMTPRVADPNQVETAVWSTALRRGGGEVIEIYLYRRDGFDGEVEVRAAGLPPGVTAAPATIGAGQAIGRLVLQAAEDAPAWTGEIRLEGIAQIDGAEVARAVRPGTFVWTGRREAGAMRSRLARGLTLSVLPEQAPYAVEIAADALATCRGAEVKAPVKLIRRGNFNERVVLLPFGLPKEAQAKPASIEPGQSEGTMEISALAQVRPGSYSFSVLGVSQLNYAHNPEAVATAEERKQKIDTVVAQRGVASAIATEKRRTAEQKASEAEELLARAKQAVAIAEQTVAEDRVISRSAAEQAKTAQAAALRQTNDTGLAEAAEAADEAAEESAAKLKAAMEAKLAAVRTASESTDSAATAKANREAADVAAELATAALKEALKYQQRIVESVRDLMNRAKPQPTRLGLPSASVTLRVAPAPVTLRLGSREAVAHRHERWESPVSITREFGFAGPVQVRLKPTVLAAGVSAAPVEISAGSSRGSLAIDVSQDAKPGERRLVVEAVAHFNGQELCDTEELLLLVERDQ